MNFATQIQQEVSTYSESILGGQFFPPSEHSLAHVDLERTFLSGGMLDDVGALEVAKEVAEGAG